MFAALARAIRPNQPAIPQRQPLVAQIIEAVGNGIDKASNLEALLVPAIQQACRYFDQEIAAIPGPVDISLAVHGQEEECTNLFPAAEHIGHALGRSLEVKESLPRLARDSHRHAFGLLGIRLRHGDTGNGHRPLADHTVCSLAPTEADARQYLRQAAFKRLITSFTAHIDQLRRKERMQTVERNIQSEIAGRTMELATTDKELAPDDLLHGLVAWLHSPEMYFRVDTGDVGAAGAALPTLHSSDRRQWLVSFVRFPVEEALQALNRETHNHRYIYI